MRPLLTLCCFGMLTVSPLNSESIPDLENLKEQASAFDAGQLVRLGGLVSSIGSGTAKLGTLLEEGNIEKIQSTLDSLDGDVDRFAGDIKEMIPDGYHGQVDQSAELINGNITRMKGYATEENLDLAREEYQKMMTNWSTLSDYYSQRLSGTLQDREETRSWMNWAVDWVYDWWQGDSGK